MINIDETRTLEVEYKKAIEAIYPDKIGDKDFEESIMFEILGSRCNSIACVYHIQRMKAVIDYYHKNFQ